MCIQLKEMAAARAKYTQHVVQTPVNPVEKNTEDDGRQKLPITALGRKATYVYRFLSTS